MRWSASPWKHFTETGAVKAKSVIIAAGGFAMNPEMVAEHTPALGQQRRTKHHGLVAPYILGNPNDDGLGHPDGRFGRRRHREHGRDVHHRGRLPAEVLLTGVIVNKEGKRFVAEDSYHSRTSAFVLEQPEQTAYLIVDEAHTEMPDDAADPVPRRLRDDRRDGNRRSASRRATWRRRWNATTILPPGARIRISTSSRNSLRRKTMAPGQCSTCHSGGRCTRGSPSAAWPSPSTAKYCATTARVIPGLYAVGACASNIAQDGKGYASGTQLGEGSFFGRRAGAHAAAKAGGA